MYLIIAIWNVTCQAKSCQNTLNLIITICNVIQLHLLLDAHFIQYA